PYGSAHHRRAPHAVADLVKVNAVAPQRTELAQAPKLSVADRPRGTVVVHRMATLQPGAGGFDGNVAAEVGHVAAIGSFALMVEVNSTIQRDLGARDGANEAFLGLGILADSLGEGVFRNDLPDSSGEDNPVAGTPAGHRLGQSDGRITFADRSAEFDPGA